jgi:hypothetical protein
LDRLDGAGQEAAAKELCRRAALAGLNVAAVSLTGALNKDVLLIERFVRIHPPSGGHCPC